jgi:hypothetical protein
MADQLSRRDVALILHRAAELERRLPETSDAITSDDLQKIAEELGMSRQALDQALAESRAGLLGSQVEQTFLDRIYGARKVVAQRFVPGTAAQVRQLVERYFREQSHDIVRRGEDWILWRRTRGVGSWLKRMSAGRHKLPGAWDYRVRIADLPGGPHPVLIQIEVDVSQQRRNKVQSATAATILGTVGAIVGASHLAMPLELAPIAGGALLAAGTTFWGRAAFKDTREELEGALGRLLDFLEHEPERVVGERGKDLVSRLLDFIGGP